MTIQLNKKNEINVIYIFIPISIVMLCSKTHLNFGAFIWLKIKWFCTSSHFLVELLSKLCSINSSVSIVFHKLNYVRCLRSGAMEAVIKSLAETNYIIWNTRVDWSNVTIYIDRISLGLRCIKICTIPICKIRSILFNNSTAITVQDFKPKFTLLNGLMINDLCRGVPHHRVQDLYRSLYHVIKE